ncbi:hypothetical protein CEXT_112161 [Caerostris extrusa]|uniref:Uncharacterized protein n=1 Tax=Caerostris extrusa TaxID=172846 RepID=A0AAV4NFD0_CAEEX|nr:hypothetical protein CEXT_112161 [Caerostris extrusa]
MVRLVSFTWHIHILHPPPNLKTGCFSGDLFEMRGVYRTVVTLLFNPGLGCCRKQQSKNTRQDNCGYPEDKHPTSFYPKLQTASGSLICRA